MEMNIGIVGAGPCGLVMAMLLAQQGYEVDIYEKRSNAKANNGSKNNRSYNIDLSYRALYTLSQLGIEQEVYDICVPVIGRLTYNQFNIDIEYYDTIKHWPIYNTTRDKLHQLLFKHAQQFTNISIHCHHYVYDIDLDNNQLNIKDEVSNSTYSCYQSKIIGCDGANSLSRASLNQVVPNNQFIDRQVCYYKEIQLPDAFMTHLRHFMHKWLGPDVSIIAHPNTDDTFSGTLLLSNSNSHWTQSYRAHDVQSFLGHYFPYLMPYVDDSFCEQILRAPLSNLNIAKVDQLYYQDHFLLIGDAAHTILPFLGQGLNSSLEDCLLFSDELLSQDHAWGKALEEFSSKRQQDIEALVNITQQATPMFLSSFSNKACSISCYNYMLRLLQKKRGMVPYQTYLYYSFLPYRYVYQLKQEQEQLLMVLLDIIGGDADKAHDSLESDKSECLMQDYFEKAYFFTNSTQIRRL